jgi:hypothetical protein
LILLCAAWIFYSHLHRYLHRDNWKVKTTPVAKETVNILCKNFELEKEHPLCNGKKGVYGPDFIDIIRDTFRPYEEFPIGIIFTYPEMATFRIMMSMGYDGE